MSSETLEKPVHEKYRMMNEWVFVEPISDAGVDPSTGFKTVADGKIIIPQTSEEISCKGRVMNIGLRDGKDSPIKITDWVLFQKSAAFKHTTVDDKKYTTMLQRKILAILFGDDAKDVNPVFDNVFIEWEEKVKYYPGTTIEIPEQHREAHYTGIVKAIGGDVKELAVGDRVFFDQFCGVNRNQFQEDGKRYAFIKEDGVICSNIPMREEPK